MQDYSLQSCVVLDFGYCFVNDMSVYTASGILTSYSSYFNPLRTNFFPR